MTLKNQPNIFIFLSSYILEIFTQSDASVSGIDWRLRNNQLELKNAQTGVQNGHWSDVTHDDQSCNFSRKWEKIIRKGIRVVGKLYNKYRERWQYPRRGKRKQQKWKTKTKTKLKVNKDKWNEPAIDWLHYSSWNIQGNIWGLSSSEWFDLSYYFEPVSNNKWTRVIQQLAIIYK